MAEIAKTMTLNLSDAEMAVVDALATEHEMSKTAVLRTALRLYQYINRRLKDGETMHFSGDANRAVQFIGLGFHTGDTPNGQ